MSSKRQFTTAIPEIQEIPKIRATDHQEYADDAILSTGPTNIQETTTQLKHYKQVTEGRQIPIQWKNRNTNHENKKMQKTSTSTIQQHRI